MSTDPLDIRAWTLEPTEDPVGRLVSVLEELEAAGAVYTDAEVDPLGPRVFGAFRPGAAPRIRAKQELRWSLRPVAPPLPAAKAPPTVRAAGAFGGGRRPTTAMMLAALQAGPCAGRVLDVGTGTGILGLAALRWGAESLWATDISAAALRSAQANAIRNGLESRCEITNRWPPAGARFELILANIRCRPLRELGEALLNLRAPGGRLLLSGLRFHEDRPLLSAWAATPRRAWLHDGWWCLEL